MKRMEYTCVHCGDLVPAKRVPAGTSGHDVLCDPCIHRAMTCPYCGQEHPHSAPCVGQERALRRYMDGFRPPTPW